MNNEIKVPIMYNGESFLLIEHLKPRLLKAAYNVLYNKLLTIGLETILKIQVNTTHGYGYAVNIAYMHHNYIWIYFFHINGDGKIDKYGEGLAL